MSERRSLWQRLFGRAGSSALSQRQERVLRYIIGRMDKGVPLQQVLGEDYVRRNCSREEVDQIVSNPELVQAARAQLRESFGSGEFKP